MGTFVEKLLCWRWLGIVVVSFAFSAPLSSPVGLGGRGSVCASEVSPAVRRFLARRHKYMMMIWYELEMYDGTYHCLPRDIHDSDGKPILSWRSISANFDAAVGPLGSRSEPWDAPVNAEAASGPCLLYCFLLPQGCQYELETKVLAISGPDTAFDPAKPRSLKDLPRDLILVIEVWRTGLHWLQPGDIDVRNYKRLRVTGPDGKGCYVLFADGTFAFLRSDVLLERVKKFCTISGAKKYDREKELGPYMRVIARLAEEE